MKILRLLRKNNKLKAFTMTEVVIATLIFSLAMAGVFASISNLRQPAIESTQEVTAAFIGKRILENLRKDVSAATWNSENLAIGTYGPIEAATVGNQTYYYNYIVAADPATNARQVTLDVYW